MSDTTHLLPALEAPAAGVRLVVVEGPDAGNTFDVQHKVLIGSSERCDFQLSDRTVSRRHVTVMPCALGLRVADAGSRNGTWLGDARIQDIELPLGSQFRVGSTSLSIEAAREPTAVDVSMMRSSFGRFVGRAPVLRLMYAQLERAIESDVTVLFEGESGTGKELLSEAIHELSPRKSGPFIVVDCGSVPENLIESELFGHEKGAFTGAERARAGAFEEANGGTIFLDEIGELPLPMQTRLLRVLDKRQVRRLGSSKRIDINVRVVAATNRNLEREVEESRFRLDLFHRLAVLLVRVPPLRERTEDIEHLINHFAKSFGKDEGFMSRDAIARLKRQPWPGNARELRNQVERTVLLGDLPMQMPEPKAAAEDTGFLSVARSGLPYRQARAQALADFTGQYVADMLERHDGNVSRAAEAAGVARRHFQRLKQT